ncbi:MULTISPECIES: helix-turn-helix domain-containing protein [unclassified Streptomyces]|uniref:helix-turn-helix domain-containing protein n=1 Tax=unclassified Streptomyces TaxID=2593676 RepID=UPI002E3739D4|nr:MULTISPECIES: helix-turn-helix domain-containing protein [unclassified Streptomyces]
MEESPDALAPGAAYAAALREAVSEFLTNGTQAQVAEALHCSASSLSRYLKGERVMPRESLRALQVFLAEEGTPLSPDVYAELDRLCGQAHAASGAPAVKLAQLEEDMRRLRAQHQQAQQVSDARLVSLEEMADRLASQLEAALERARTAEGAAELLTVRGQEQDESLRHAQDYIHQIEAELAGQREQARLLQQEAAVLRAQNRRLIEEQAAGISGVSTQAGGPGTTHQQAGRTSDGGHSTADVPGRDEDPGTAPADGRSAAPQPSPAGPDWAWLSTAGGVATGLTLVILALFNHTPGPIATSEPTTAGWWFLGSGLTTLLGTITALLINTYKNSEPALTDTPPDTTDHDIAYYQPLA